MYICGFTWIHNVSFVSSDLILLLIIPFSCLTAWARTLYMVNMSTDSNDSVLILTPKGKFFITAQLWVMFALDFFYKKAL